ncbi:reverse transcriptase domain-containing protein [endosymbiont of Ridgeia piscesae]|nr:reverse transcriptase domain-containing protein [endosymbiont of Ridgeia piscesae]
MDMDIKEPFDDIDHDLLMRAVRKHVKNKWEILYIERWLKAPIRHREGRLELRERGTSQGDVVSPLLANLYLHYVFYTWVEWHCSGIQFERCANDIVCHTARVKKKPREGWIKYYGRYGCTELRRVLFYLIEEIAHRAKWKYKRLRSKHKAVRWFMGVHQR